MDFDELMLNLPQSDLERYAFPDKRICGELPGFAFNIGRELWRIENHLTDLLDLLIHDLHDRIDVMITKYAAAGVDCIMFTTTLSGE